MLSSPQRQSPNWHFLLASLAGMLFAALGLCEELRGEESGPNSSSSESAELGYWVANELELTDLQVELGVAGRYKLGSWTELRIRLPVAAASNPPKLAVVASDSDGVPVEYTAPGIVGGNWLTYRVPVKIGRRNSNLQIQFVSEADGGERTSIREIPIAAISESIAATQRWFVSIGPDIGFESAIKRISSQTSSTNIHSVLTNPQQLPRRWFLLEGVDVIVWSATDTAFIKQLDEAQLTALHRWLKMGGRLVVSVGSNAEEIIGPNQPLARFVPGTFDRTTEIRDASELESLVARERGLERNIRGELEVIVLADPAGKILVEERFRQSSFPLWIRAADGFGVVDFFGIDFTTQPIASWDGSDILLRVLLEDLVDSSDEGRSSNQAGNSVAHLGFTDLSGQLRMALDQFPGVQNVSFFLIGTILVVYLALIGPGDYFLLRRLKLRMEWTWVTFPGLILLSIVGILWLATWSKGTDIKSNYVEVIDIDISSKQVRTTSWFHVFSPQTERYDISVRQDNVPVADWNQLASWQGQPGSGLGGMNTRQSVSAVPTQAYRIPFSDDDAAGGATLNEMPIQIWSSKTMMSRGWGSLVDQPRPPLIELESQLIEGTIYNPTDIELSDCYLFHGRWAYFIPKMPPGGSAQILRGQSVQNSEKVLKRRRNGGTRNLDIVWNRQDTDVDRIMEMTMFHQIAGGSAFTNLSNQFHGYVDLSSHVELQRAILVGKVRNAESAIQIDGESVSSEDSQAWSYVRIVYPVQKRSDSELAQQ